MLGTDHIEWHSIFTPSMMSYRLWTAIKSSFIPCRELNDRYQCRNSIKNKFRVDIHWCEIEPSGVTVLPSMEVTFGYHRLWLMEGWVWLLSAVGINSHLTETCTWQVYIWIPAWKVSKLTAKLQGFWVTFKCRPSTMHGHDWCKSDAWGNSLIEISMAETWTWKYWIRK